MSCYEKAYNTWLAAAPLRAARERHKRYTYGDQWSDPVDDHCGNLVPESSLLIASGKRPQTNNLIRRLVKTIVGLYRSSADGTSFYTDDVRGISSQNELPELDARLLEEFIISGCAVQRVVAERRPGGSGVWIDNVNPRRFFVNRFTDPRGSDIDFVGMLHDMTWCEIVNRFGRGSRQHINRLQVAFNTPPDFSAPAMSTPLGVADDAVDFVVAPEGRFRVIETWQLEGRQTSRAGRVAMDMVWRCRWYTAAGQLLDEYNSPFAHRCHPFCIRFYPLTDGEVHSFVEDVIDQQRGINRLVVLLHHMMASSAKGALLYPINQLPEGMGIDEITDLWARPDAVIPVTGRGHEMPRQVMGSTAGSAPAEMLQLQMRLFDEISGIGDTLLGRNISPSVGADRYNAQLQTASLVLTDLLQSFTTFTARRNRLALTT